ncbi:hypothetical protein H2203_000119 [Taxawa tesnikishii (nom. ined.)]|nr:hypothetical protein H2203_000119 [Dothideales sp. JES 119]
MDSEASIQQSPPMLPDEAALADEMYRTAHEPSPPQQSLESEDNQSHATPRTRPRSANGSDRESVGDGDDQSDGGHDDGDGSRSRDSLAGDDRIMSFYPFHEEDSIPHEEELKSMEAVAEQSAYNDDYWEQRCFFSLADDPEIVAGESGKIEWRADKFFGTKENPNRSLIMFSDTVSIGGYDWRIKLLPRGNDSTDRVGVFVENVSISSMADEEWPEDQLPLPSISGIKVMQRRSVAAQIGVLMYNPDESRVHEFKSDAHQFTRDSPDYGWSRFTALPWYELHRRQYMQRQPLVHRDKLAVKAFVRVVDDSTRCLWAKEVLPRDMVARTGSVPPPSGPIGIVLSLWLHSDWWRSLLQSITISEPGGAPSPEVQQSKKSTPLLESLQKMLYYMRSRTLRDTGWLNNIAQEFQKALQLDSENARYNSSSDVVQTMDAMCAIVGKELLYRTASVQHIRTVFEEVVHRLPIAGHTTIQGAVNAFSDWHRMSIQGHVVNLELERQVFDKGKRCFKKLMHKVELSDHITVHDELYTLYAVVTHRGFLTSGSYRAYIRPAGIGTSWYRHGNSSVTCLTRKEAVVAHEGKSDMAALEEPTSNDARDRYTRYLFSKDEEVAYFVCYVRDEAEAEDEEWDVPEWIVNSFKDPIDGLGETARANIPLPEFPLLPAASAPLISEMMSSQTREDVIMSDAPEVDEGGDTHPIEPLPVPTFLLNRTSDGTHENGIAASDDDRMVQSVVLEVNGPSGDASSSFPKDDQAAEYQASSPTQRNGTASQVEQVVTHDNIRYFGQSFYNGGLLNGDYHGEGHLIYLSGDEYDGSFSHGKRQGQGSMTYQNGDTYKGEWQQDTHHGQGTYTEAKTGNVYSGGWEEGRKCGEGVTYWKVSEEEKKLCRICVENEVDAAFYDCGHVVACRECANQVVDCPVCRKRVRDVLKLYYMA